MHGWAEPGVLFVARAVVVVLLAGTIWRVFRWLRSPVARRVPLMPAPRSQTGVVWLMLHESLLFTTLFKASRWTWLFGWVFHLGLALVLLQHLRYVSSYWWPWLNWLAAWGHVASAMMILGLLGLSARRVLVDRLRFISRVSDHAILVLLAAIAVSGVVLKYHWPVNVVVIRDFVRGVLWLAEPVPLPAHWILLVHVSLAAVFVLILPFGKLMHGPALWINPTRAQADVDRPGGQG